MNNIIESKGLSCGYGNQIVLDKIDFKIKSGEMLGVIGPNGCGKTTLLKTISGFLKPLAGSMQLKGRDLNQCPMATVSRSLAVVNQNPAPISISVKEYVTMGRLPYFKKFQFFECPEDRIIIEQNLELTDSTKNMHRSMNELSGGERQLAQIARALTQQPEILLLDEPTSHLDITHQIRILDLVRKLNKESGLTVIMVIHDLNMAAEYCDRLIMLNHGEIYLDETSSTVLTIDSLQEVYTAKVVVNLNPLSGKPLIIPVTEESVTNR